MSDVCKHWKELDDENGYVFEFCRLIREKCTCGAGINNCDSTKERICSEKGHDWLEIVKPNGNRSGYHVDKCIKCGKMQTYDTSD